MGSGPCYHFPVQVGYIYQGVFGCKVWPYIFRLLLITLAKNETLFIIISLFSKGPDIDQNFLRNRLPDLDAIWTSATEHMK